MLPTQTLLPTSSAPPAPARNWTGLATAHWWWLGVAVLFAWGGLWNKLRIDWTLNEQYEYGWFVPPLAAILLAMRWRDRPAPAPLPRGWRMALGICAAFGLLLLLPIRIVEGPNPDWRLLFWMHASVLVGLSGILLLSLGGWPWARHFGFPVFFLVLAVPWPSGPEQRIVQSLMRGVAAIAAGCMGLLGVPAVTMGNVIRVHEQWVGVNEACSGIRSLQTTLMACLALGELSRVTWGRRLGLLGGGVVLAFAANVLRSSFLVWIAASHGSAVMERYHDVTGVAVLLIVFAGLLVIDRLLARRQAGGSVARPTAGGARSLPNWVTFAICVWLVAIEIGNVVWYSAAPGKPLVQVPRWTIAPPTDARGFKVVPIEGETTRLLRYDQGQSVRWFLPAETAAPEECALYFFRWEPGHASNLQADLHQPHICLVASGLTLTADWGTHPMALPDGLTLPVHRYEFTIRGRTIYVFFVVWQDAVSGEFGSGDEAGSKTARLRAALERRPIVGRQTLEFLVAGPPDMAAANDIFAQEMTQVIRRED